MPRPAWLTARPVAHRGLHDREAGRIENTLAAAEAAVARGFAIECDVRLTADSEVVVFHDDDLDRLTAASGAVRSRSFAELMATEIVGSGVRMPTLAELLALVAGRVPLFVELKGDVRGDSALARRTAAILADYAGPVAVMSFDPGLVRAMAGLSPGIPRGIVADDYSAAEWPAVPAGRRFALRHLLHAPWTRPDFVAFGVLALPANAPLLLRHLGLPLLAWTVRTAADRETARRYADQIIFEDFDPESIGRAREQGA